MIEPLAHVPREVLVFDGEIQLQVLPGARVQVVAADGDEGVVDDGGLGVHDAIGEGVHLDAVAEERVEQGLDRVLHDGDVALLGHQHPDPNALIGRADQRAAHGPVGDEVAVRDVDAMLRVRDAMQILAPHVAPLAPRVREDPHAARASAAELPQILGDLGPAHLLPGVVEERAQLLHGLPTHCDHVVAPAVAGVVDGKPLAGQVDAAGEREASVDDEELAVIAALDDVARQRGDRGAEDGVEGPHLAAREHERRPELGHQRHAAEGVVDDDDAHASLRGGDERIEEAKAAPVGAHPVHLEEDLVGGVLDGLQHGREGLDAVAQQRDLVAAHWKPARRAQGFLVRGRDATITSPSS